MPADLSVGLSSSWGSDDPENDGSSTTDPAPEQSSSRIGSLFDRPDPDLRLVSQVAPQGLLRKRFAAGVFDTFVAYFFGTVLAVILFNLGAGAGLFSRVPSGETVLVVTIVLSTPYFLLLEVVWGQTIGKRIVDLQVVSSDGTLNTPWQAVIRNVLRPVDSMTLAAVFLIPGLVTQKRLGDIAADTVVGKRAKPQEGTADGYPHVQVDTDRQIIVPGSDQRTIAERIAAGCIDFFPAFCLSLFVFAYWFVVYAGVTGLPTTVEGSGLFLAQLAVAMAVYHPLLEMTWGTTPGRRLLKLRVATTRGTTPVGRQLFVKNVLRPVDYILFPVTGLFLLFTERSQRPSDMVAGTVVGKRKPAKADATEAATSDDDPIEGPSQPDGPV